MADQEELEEIYEHEGGAAYALPNGGVRVLNWVARPNVQYCMDIQELDGKMQVVALVVMPADPTQPIWLEKEDITGIPWTDLKQGARLALSRDWLAWVRRGGHNATRLLLDEDSHLQAFALEWTKITALGLPAREILAEDLHLGKDRISQIIKLATDKGYLPPAAERQAFFKRPPKPTAPELQQGVDHLALAGMMAVAEWSNDDDLDVANAATALLNVLIDKCPDPLEELGPFLPDEDER